MIKPGYLRLSFLENSIGRTSLPNGARTLGTRLFVSQDTWDQVLRNVLSGDRLPNRARTLGTRLFVSQDTWDQVLRNVLSGDRLPNRARTLGTRFLGTYSLAIDFLIEPGHLGPGSP